MFTGPQSPTPLIIVVVVLLLFGAKRIPELARDLGAGVREFKKGAGSEGETELEEAFDPHEERKTPLASSHAGLIHPTAAPVSIDPYMLASRHETIFKGSEIEGARCRRRWQSQG